MGSTGLFGTWEKSSTFLGKEVGWKRMSWVSGNFKLRVRYFDSWCNFGEKSVLHWTDRGIERRITSIYSSTWISTMPMPRPRARPRLTRMSTSSTSAFRQWNPRIYTFLVAGVVLLFVSISYLQMSLGGASSFHRPHHRSIKLDDPGMAVSPVLTSNPLIMFILVVYSSNSFQLTLCPGVKKNNLSR